LIVDFVARAGAGIGITSCEHATTNRTRRLLNCPEQGHGKETKKRASAAPGLNIGALNASPSSVVCGGHHHRRLLTLNEQLTGSRNWTIVSHNA
jgi:hypothetical protein